MIEDDYYWEIYEVFREQIEDQMPQIESSIILLDNPSTVGDAIDDLFRVFHNYKATAHYLKLQPLQEISHKAETVLGSLREEKKVVQESLIEWIFQIKDQIERWLDQMQNQETVLSEVSPELNQKIKITKSYISPINKMKSLTLLYIDSDEKRAKKIVTYLGQILKNVEYCNITNYKSIIKNYDIVMTNMDKDNYNVIDYTANNFINLPLIAIFDSINKDDKIKLLKSSVSQYNTNPLTSKKLLKELSFITKTYFSSKNIMIDNKKINEFIKELKPLPNTIYQITQVCDDDEKSIHDLIKIVKTDPIITANILKYANSPVYGSSKIITIDQAITRLGKKVVKAISVSEIYKNINPINLSSYEIDLETFSKVSQMRLTLILKWYSKVNIADLSILSSTALLGNIGQLLISQELIDMQEVESFKKLYPNFGVDYAEESIVHTKTSLVSAQILNFWKLSENIVDVITYADNPEESPDEIKHLAIANHIVYSLIDIMGNVVEQIPNDTLELMGRYSLDPKPLNNALDFIINNK